MDALFTKDLVNNYGWGKKNAERGKHRRTNEQTHYPNTQLEFRGQLCCYLLALLLLSRAKIFFLFFSFLLFIIIGKKIG